MKLKQPKPILAITLILPLAVGTSILYRNVQRERLVDSLTQASTRTSEIPLASREERKASLISLRRLNSLWFEHKDRDVSEELTQFLQNPNRSTRGRAVRMLARLGNPATAQVIRSQQKSFDAEKTTDLVTPRVLLEMALARIETRSLSGQSRVAAVAKSAGLSFDALAALSRRLNAGKEPARVSIGKIIFDEIVDLLYTMADRGEDITAITQKLALSPAQKTLLSAAPLPAKDEAKMIVDYLAPNSRTTLDETMLSERYLVELGTAANDELLNCLQDIHEHTDLYTGLVPSPGRPGAFTKRDGYVDICRAAASTGDQRMLPRLAKLVQNRDRWLAYYADQAIDALKSEQNFLSS